MEPIDTDPLTILVWSDWLEEHNQSELAQEVRAKVTKEPEPYWNFDYRRQGVGSIGSGVIGEVNMGIIGVRGVGSVGNSVGVAFVDGISGVGC